MDDEVKDKPGEGGAKGESPEEQDYVQMIMDRHKPLSQRGSAAIARAIIIPIVIAAIVLAVVWVALVNLGDSYMQAEFADVLRQARQPLVTQNFIERLFTPNFDHLKSMSVGRVLYVGKSDMVLIGGWHVRVEGVDNLRDYFKQARQMGSAPIFRMSCHDRRIHLDELMIVDEIVLTDKEIRVIERLDLLSRMPERSTKSEPGKIRRAPAFAYDDEDTFKKFVGQTIALAGKPVREEGGWILEGENWRMRLVPVADKKEFDTILDLALQNDEPLMVDVVFAKSYPWRDRKQPERSRSETQIVGEATMVSASLQGLHVGATATE